MKLIWQLIGLSMLLYMTPSIAEGLASPSLPLSQTAAAEMVADETGNKVISSHVDQHDNAILRVKTLTNKGHIKVYRIDVNTGKIKK